MKGRRRAESWRLAVLGLLLLASFINIASWLWSWPNRFLDRMALVGSAVFIIGPYHGGDFSTGLDSAEDLARLPDGYSGGVLTNEIASEWLRSRR